LSAKEKAANGENNRSAAMGAESGCVSDGTVTSSTQPKMSRNATNAAPGTIATAHSAAVRTGRVVGVTPTTGSLSRIERVSQYMTIIPKPPRKTAGYPTTSSISTTPALSPVPMTTHIPTANRKTGLTTNRRSSRAASGTNVGW
jgi:hypothetical protein